MPAPNPNSPDRVSRIKRALLEMVAEHGFGASMSSIARRASVGTGTAYVHFRSKDELVLATYLDAKHDLAEAVVADINMADPPQARFLALWRNMYDYLSADRAIAQFLIQVDASPFADAAHEAAMSVESALREQAAAPDLQALMVPLPLRLIYELSLGVAVRLAAGDRGLTDAEKHNVALACWRAVTQPDQQDHGHGSVRGT